MDKKYKFVCFAGSDLWKGNGGGDDLECEGHLNNFLFIVNNFN